jgi:hypothetical protein
MREVDPVATPIARGELFAEFIELGWVKLRKDIHEALPHNAKQAGLYEVFPRLQYWRECPGANELR